MAQIITTPVEYSGRNNIDFERFADGNDWLLVRGDDYTVKTNTLITAARKYGRENGYEVDAKRFSDDGQESVALRFRSVNLTEPVVNEAAPSE